MNRDAQRRAAAGFADETIRLIRKQLAAGLSRQTIALQHQCSPDTIGKIARFETYWWVKDAPPPPSEGAASLLSTLASLSQGTQNDE